MNIQFTLVETSQPNAFTTALANAITAQKSAIQDTVDNRLKGVSAQVEAEAKQKNVTTAKTAFDTYKAAYDTATATAQAFASASNEQKNVLRAQYAIQREAAHLTEILAEAAFKQANLDWPNGGLGALPPKL
uniref:Uncharacterized protein n=1 Tax=Curvibacter symbiont subsp. Hydra magnipapillata TaxID=667019 RepID=C9Y725_CURXX|nr:hypothetical protein Csp_H40080 [Curvibacter putative symbiont of Hydra magnipapillata]